MKRFHLIDRLGLLFGAASVLGLLSGCAATPRPKALDDASEMLTHNKANELEALKPKLIREAKGYLRKATEAHERGDQREAELYAHMAMNRFLTAQNLVRSTSARRLAKEMVARRGDVAGEADQLRSRQDELKRFQSLERRIAQIHDDLNKKPEGDAPEVVAAKRALSRARRKQAEAIGAGAPTSAPAEYQQGSSLVTSAVESLELGIFSESQQSASQAVTVFDGAIAKARAPKPEAPADPKLADKEKAENALTDASSAQALALAVGAPQSAPNLYQRGTVLLSSAERSFDRDNYAGALKLARQSKDAFDSAAAGPTSQPAEVSSSPAATGDFGAERGTLFDNRPIGQILLSLRFERASMLGKRQDETCPATFKEFEAILELADERLKLGDTASAREFVIRAQERLTKCKDGTGVVAPPVSAEPKVDVAQALSKQNAATALQKAQTALATARRTIGDDPRLAQPTALLASADKWFDREAFGQTEQLANQALIAIATIVATPATKAEPKVEVPAVDAVKDEAAALIQRGQTMHAELVVKLGDDKRLAVPQRRLEAAERWFDRDRFPQAREEAKQAVAELAKLERADKPASTDPPKAKTEDELAAESAIEAAKDARVKARVALVADEKLKAPDKLLELAETAMTQGRAKSSLLYAKKAEEEYLASLKAPPRVEIVSVPKPAAQNTCREAFLKIAHAERLAQNTNGTHLTPGEKRQREQGVSLSTIATVRMDDGKCDEALMLGEEAVATLFPVPLRPAGQPAPTQPKPKASPKKPKASPKKPKASPKKPKALPGQSDAPTVAARSGNKSWKVAYDKTRRALEKREIAEGVVTEAMQPTLDRGNRALESGRTAYKNKRYTDAERHADVAIAQFEAVIAASGGDVSPAPRPSTAPRPGTDPRPAPRVAVGAPAAAPKPGAKPEASWKAPYRAIYAALDMQREAKKVAKSEESRKALAVGDQYMDKAQVAWKGKKYKTAHTHATAAMVAFKLAIDGAPGEKEPPAEVTYKDADASLREARVILSVCERDKCAERDFKSLESAKLMLTSAEEAMKKADYTYADDLAKQAKTKMLAILDKPRPLAPKVETLDPDAVKKAKDAIAEAQIQQKLCGPRDCSKLNLEGTLRAEQDLAAARSALADGDPDRATRLAETAGAAYKAIEAPKASAPTFTIPADVTSVTRAGSQLYVTPPVAFSTGSTLIDKGSKPSVEALAKVLKANASLIKSIKLIGYTDNRGGAGLNKAISAKRALSVAKALELEGVDKAVLSSEGRGIESPVADNSTAEGRAANRRVEIHIELN